MAPFKPNLSNQSNEYYCKIIAIIKKIGGVKELWKTFFHSKRLELPTNQAPDPTDIASSSSSVIYGLFNENRRKQVCGVLFGCLTLLCCGDVSATKALEYQKQGEREGRRERRNIFGNEFKYKYGTVFDVRLMLLICQSNNKKRKNNFASLQ